MSQVLQIYHKTTCIDYFLSRFVYVCNFFMVSFTIFYWIHDFTKREIKVVPVPLIGGILVLLNIIFVLCVIIAFIFFYSEGNNCLSNNGTIESWNTWICIGCLWSTYFYKLTRSKHGFNYPLFWTRCIRILAIP